VDVFLGIFHLEEEELGDYGIGHIVVNGSTDEDNAVFQQATVNIPGTFSTSITFKYVG